MPILSVIVSRDALGLPPLELSSDPDSATYWLAQAPAQWPLPTAGWSDTAPIRPEARTGARPDARPGSPVPLPRRRESDAGDPAPLALPRPRAPELVLPLEVLVSGRSAVELYAARSHLGQVLGQRVFEVIVVRARRESLHRAGPSSPVWSSVLPGACGARCLRASVRIPLPDPASARVAPARPA